jgi:hypothetical protein
MTKPFLTTQEFFGGIFQGCYVFALGKAHGQTNGTKPIDHCRTSEEYDNFFAEKYLSLNESGFGIHFTPNGIKDVALKNKLENLEVINSWYVDVDIEETKIITGEHTLFDRNDKKGEILGKIFESDLWPSLVVETRNGYHLYWFAIGDATEKMFPFIQKRLAKMFDGDPAAMGIMHSLRVPEFKYHKHGEEGIVRIVPMFSSLAQHYEEDLIKFTGATFEEKIQNAVLPERKTEMDISLFPQGESVWDIVEKVPKQKIIEMLSGTEEVNGEIFTFVKSGDKKLNILSNGQVTPNFIDESTNLVFSNTETGFCTIRHFVRWYGLNDKEVFRLFRKLVDKMKIKA